MARFFLVFKHINALMLEITPQIFLLGAIAKLGATVVTYPLLVVKARLQVKQVLHDDKRRQYT
ncbi:hypothetical protein B296_00005861, partial [Ensete ventricosum]